ncbi:MAG: ABC transporter permease [Tissierellia bacterium]|nr:ABC transporter permease [Tissierellia bacterium]
MDLAKRIKRNSNIIILLILLMASVFAVSIQSEYFFTFQNLKNILEQSSIYLILALSMTFVITSGGIDLSIGSILGITGVIMAMLLKNGLNSPVAIAIGLLLGTIIGSINGYIIAYLGMSPFIVTLCTMSIFRGASVLISKGQPIFNLPYEYQFIGSGKLLEMSIPVIESLLLSVIAFVVFHYTRFGYYTLGLGNNEEALRRSGIPVQRLRLIIYALSGLFAAIVGLIVSARLNTAEPLAGLGIEMDVIAIVVLGGTSIRGGRGSVSGTFIACFLLGVIKNSLIMLKIASNFQQLLIGMILLITVILSEMKHKKVGV